jgi:asparagine synthase (glutamine-hydrolysing)
MCGITGILSFNEKGKKSLHKISAATYALLKRGPDAEGIYSHNNAALGHRRLSIIDTSNAASQPFTDATGRFTIVFNGEIFNFHELRNQLENKGFVFKSQSDTEVLLYLYINEKENCLSKLDGEFAFAVYDNINENLFLARDRFGIKPLYFYKDENLFAFASEIKALQKFDIPKEIDKTSLQIYFHLNYIPAPYSIFKNVFKLDAGSYLTINLKSELKKEAYYSIPFSNPETSPDYVSAQKQLKYLLEESVKKRMIADVPLGTFLSGGIDSSVITAIAAQNTKHLNTFSIGYKDEPLFDETYYAELVAKKYKTNHTVFSLTNNDLYANLHQVLDYIDEPFADSSVLAVNILSMHTKKYVTVALSGDGADELFAGYNKHAAELRVRKGVFQNALVKTSLPLLKLLPKSRHSKTGNKIRQLQKFAEGMSLDPKERYWKWAGFTGEELFSNSENENDFNIRKKDILKFIGDDYNSVLYTDMQLVLENDMLVKVDRMSMCNSLEVRVPFLDHKIVDFAFSLPENYKIDNHQRKKIIKDAFREYLPEELYGRGKQGFEVPLLKWFKTDLKSMIIDDLLSDKFISEQNIFNLDTIKKLKNRLFSNDPDDSVAKVWALIVFQYWWKKTYK